MFIVIDAIGPMTTVAPGPLQRMLRRGEVVATTQPDTFRFVKDDIGLITAADRRAAKWAEKHGVKS